MSTSQPIIIQNSIQQQVSAKALTLARLSTLGALCALPFSHFLVNQFAVIAVLASLFTNNWQQKWQFWRNKYSLLFGVLFMSWIFISIFYSHVSLGHAYHGFAKYAKIIYIPFLVPLFFEEKWRHYAIYSFIASVLLATLIASLATFHWINIASLNFHPIIHVNQASKGVFVNPSYFCLLAAFAAYFLLQYALVKQGRKFFLYAILIALLVGYIFLVNAQRTGGLIFILLLGQLVFYHRNKKMLCIAGAYLLLIGLGSLLVQNDFIERAQSIILTPQTPFQQHTRNTASYRYKFAKDSLKIIKKHPIIGVGSGAFSKMYAEVGGFIEPDHDPYLLEPHNAFIFITVQAGIIGLVLMLLWLWSIWRDAKHFAPRPSHLLIQALLIGLIANSLINASISSSTSGNFYTLMLGVFMGGFGSGVSRKTSNKSGAL